MTSFRTGVRLPSPPPTRPWLKAPNGEPMPLYHGTDTDFTTFDIDGVGGGAAYFAYDRFSDGTFERHRSVFSVDSERQDVIY